MSPHPRTVPTAVSTLTKAAAWRQPRPRPAPGGAHLSTSPLWMLVFIFRVRCSTLLCGRTPVGRQDPASAAALGLSTVAARTVRAPGRGESHGTTASARCPHALSEWDSASWGNTSN